MEGHFNFLPLLLVLLLAFLVPLLLARVRWLPVVVGEILAGVLVGGSGLGWVRPDVTLEIFGNIGLAFLMFLAGLEIDFNRLLPSRISEEEKGGPNYLGLSFLAYLVTLGLAVPGGFLLSRAGIESTPWLLAFILSATSLGVLLPVLKTREMTHTPAGTLIFYTAMLADFLTVILLTVYVITLENGLDVQIFLLGLLFLAFFLAYRLLSRFNRMGWYRQLIEEMSHVTVQIKVRGAIAILMAFVVLAGYLGAELILGAFLAGMIISLLKTSEDVDLIHKLEAFGFGFFIPVFFILVGAELDLRALFASPQSLLLLPVLLLVSLVVKVVPSLVFRKVIPLKETIASGLLLNTHLSLEIAVAVIGLQLGILSPAANVALILFAVITVLVMPVGFNALFPRPRETEEDRYMLIFGAEDIGLQVGKIFQRQNQKVMFLEPDIRLVQQAKKAGFEVIEAPSIEECLRSMNGRISTTALLALSAEDTRNLLVGRAAVEQGYERVIALVNNPARLPDYRALGVIPYSPSIYRPSLLAMMARSPDIFTLLTSTTDDQDVREFTLVNPLIDSRRLSTLGLPSSLLVLAVNRDGEMIVPHGKTRLQLEDRLTIIGAPEELDRAQHMIENPVGG